MVYRTRDRALSFSFDCGTCMLGPHYASHYAVIDIIVE